jgi:hypothetical protein
VSPLVGPWIIVSVCCLIAVAILLPRGHDDAAFVVGALGLVAGFLNYRSRIRGTIVEATETTDTDRDASDEDDEQ